MIPMQISKNDNKYFKLSTIFSMLNSIELLKYFPGYWKLQMILKNIGMVEELYGQ